MGYGSRDLLKEQKVDGRTGRQVGDRRGRERMERERQRKAGGGGKTVESSTNWFLLD